MLHRLPAFVAAVFAASAAYAQTSPPASPDILKLGQTTKRIEVHADGSSVMTMHNEMQLLPGAPVGLISRQKIPYYKGMQAVAITAAYTLKPDGRRVAVPPDAVTTEPEPIPSGGGAASGRLQKVIPFPNVEIGDTLVYDLVSHMKPVIAGGYTYSDVISPNLARDETRTTITAPNAMPLYTDTRGVDVSKAVADHTTTYTVTYSVKNPVSDANQFVAAADRERRFTVSSYKTYDDLAAAYAGLVLPKIVVTPKIQALADQTTAGIADRRERAKSIYRWIAKHLTYTAEDFGTGRYIPHAAEAVLASGKGDCKDHAVLFMALLKAAGIDANMVLIDAQNGFTIGAVPDLAQFNHVIVWLPYFGAYVDPTAHAAPFGVLQYGEYGKPVMHIADGTGALHRTPSLAIADSTLLNKTVAAIDEQGRLTVRSGSTITGPASIALRSLGDRMRARGPQDYLTLGLMTHRLHRESGTFELPPLSELTPQYTLTAAYTTTPDPRFLSGDAIPRPEGVTIVPPAEAAFAGPIANEAYKDADPVACYSGQAIDDFSLEFPATSRLALLPQDAAIRTANIQYTSHWSLDGRVVRIHREYRARFDQPLCTGETRTSATAALARIREDYKTDIRLKPAHR